MAVFRIRKRSTGGFTVVGTLGDGSNFSAREVAKVADLAAAAQAIEKMASGFADTRKNARG